MLKQTSLAILMAGTIAVPSTSRPQPAQLARECLHGRMELPADRTRREAALRMAQQINAAEAAASLHLPGRPVQFRPFDELRNVPPAPAGFHLQFYTDGPTYTFSLKDTLDPCEFAIFSDQERLLYEATPQPQVRVVPTGDHQR